MLDLLEHRIREATVECVAGDEEHGQTIGHGDTGRGDHVGGTRSDGGGRHHELLAAYSLGISDRGQRHALLVLPPPQRQLRAMHLQGVTEAGDIAVAKDGEDTGDERRLDGSGPGCGLDDGALGDEIAHDGLGGGDQHVDAPRSTTGSQVRDAQEVMRACCTLTTLTASAKPGEKVPPVASASRKTKSSVATMSSKPIALA